MVFQEIYLTYLLVLKFLQFNKKASIVLVIISSIFRITRLLKFLIPIKLFFELHDNGAMTEEVIILLFVLAIAIALEASYQVLNQSLRFKIAQKYILMTQSSARMTVLNFTNSSIELTVSTLAVITSTLVIGWFSSISAIAFLVIFLLGLNVLIGKYQIHKQKSQFDKISDFKEMLISVYSVLSLILTTLVYFYDWWNEAELQNFILGFFLLRFMVNISASLFREYLRVSKTLNHKSLSGLYL